MNYPVCLCAGPITFAVGDYVIYSGTIWQRSSGAVGTVTSVGITESGDALTITGSPITTSGTINIGFAGTGAQYIKGDGTLATFPNTIDQAKNLITEVYNSTGATLTKGTVVYINGGQGNLPTVTKALASGDSTSAQTYGIVQNDITNNNNGFVVVAGRLSDIDTQAFSVGTQLYLSSTTAGAYTSTKQYAPAHLVYVGIIVRSHPTQGIIEVKIQNGYEMDELHNVAAQTPTNNDGLFWESSTSLWKNKSIATILGYTPQAQLNGTGFVKASGTTITYDNSTYLTTSAAATTYLPLVLSSTANVVDINGQQFNIWGSAGGFTSGRIIVDPVFSAIGYQNAGVFDGLKILTNGNAEFSNSGITRFFNQVRFDSTLTNGTYTYTLPGATGTLALVSQLTGGTVTSVGLSVPTGFAVSGSPVTSSGTLALAFDTGYSLPTIVKQNNWDTAYNTRIVTASSPLSFISNTISISQASGSANGFLSSTDWTTFNNKQNALTNPVTGTGTTNYLPKFTGASTIANSIISESGSVITIAGNLNIGSLGSLSINAGTAATPLLTQTTSYTEIYRRSGGVGIYLGGTGDAANYYDNTIHYFRTSGGGATRMTIDASGNLGLGVSPSAWNSPFKAIQIGNTTALWNVSSVTGLSNNMYNDGTASRYLTTDFATIFEHSSGQYRWLIAPSGTTGNAISFTQAMTLDASGRLGIGTTSPGYRLQVYNSANGTTAAFGGTARGLRIDNDGTFSSGRTTIFGVDNTFYGSYQPLAINGSILYFGVAGNDNMVINASGNVGIGTSSPNSPLEVYGQTRVSASGGSVFLVTPNATSTNGIVLESSYYGSAGYGPMNFHTGGTERLRITSGGEVYIAGTTDQGAYNLQVNGTGVWGAGAYVNGSDFRLKENISDLDNSLELINKMKPVTYNYKGSYSKDSSTQTGFIAQDLKELLKDKKYLDGIVKQGPEYMSVAYQNLIPLLVKGIQELKQELDILKNK